MQDAPDRDTLLANVALFLMTQVEPALKAHPEGRGLAFRTRIAAHLIMTVGRELAAEDEHDAAELERLHRVLGLELPQDPPLGAARRAAIGDLRGRLAKRLRDADAAVDGRSLGRELMQTLREQLEVIQPRFDTRMHWPGDDVVPAPEEDR